MHKLLAILIAFILIIGCTGPAQAVTQSELDTVIAETAAFILRTVPNPEVGSVGGEWVVIGLARSGYNVPDAFFENYYRAVEEYVRERNGILDQVRYTEYARVILGLTAAGFDPRNVAGFDLTHHLGDFERTIWQGINGPIFALLALDSLNYPIPVNENAQIQATREMYIAEILKRQTSDGGWSLTAGINGQIGNNEIGDADITGIVLQALAKYRDNSEVRTAIDRGLVFLSGIQDDSGGFSGDFSGGSSAVESAVQVLVALSELGIPIDDHRFVKNGNTLVDNILSFRNPDGSFSHSLGSIEGNLMSTEQALYGLVAAQRVLAGKNSLYRMSDTVMRGEFTQIPPVETAGLPNKHADVRRAEIISPGRTFTDVQNHSNQGAIEALAARGIITGKSETLFDPDATMTRAEFAAIITRGLGLPERTVIVFTDIPSTAWFMRAVGTAYYYEIVTGTSAAIFNPNGTITRQEAAVMIARGARLCGMDTSLNEREILNILAQFGDYRTAAGWAQDALAFCYREGILDDSEFYIQPLAEITRGEIAEMLYRLLGKSNLL